MTDAFDGLHRAPAPASRPTLGAWLDPMADKLLVATMFVMLTVPGLGMAERLPLWLTVLVLSRDIGIVLTVAIVNLAVSRRTFRPTLLGKAATAVYVLTGVVALYANYRGEPLRDRHAVRLRVARRSRSRPRVEYVLRITRGGIAETA